jgi:hypothetical protein
MKMPGRQEYTNFNTMDGKLRLPYCRTAVGIFIEDEDAYATHASIPYLYAVWLYGMDATGCREVRYDSLASSIRQA